MDRDEIQRRNREREAAGVPYVGYPCDEQCIICDAVDMNQSEPRFCYVVCRRHAHLSPVEVGAQRAAREAAEARMAYQRAVTGRTDATKPNQSQPPSRGPFTLFAKDDSGLVTNRVAAVVDPETGAVTTRTGLTLQDRMTLWRDHTKEHPIHRQTGDEVARPKGVAAKMLGDFIAVPMPELGVIFWAFKRQVDADFFDANYPVIKEEVRGQ